MQGCARTALDGSALTADWPPGQAIKAMMQALKAGPEDTEVMLSLGVSFTNELDQIHALGHLHRWLRSHPVHGPMAAAAASAGGGCPALLDQTSQSSFC